MPRDTKNNLWGFVCLLFRLTFFAVNYNLHALSRVHTESWILEKVLKFALQFSRSGKSLENGDIVWKKWLKVLSFFFKATTSNNFFALVKSYSISPVCLRRIMKKSFVPAFLIRSLLITYLITSSLENEIIVFEKSLEKVLNFRSKSLYEPSLNAFLLLGAVILKNVVTTT